MSVRESRDREASTSEQTDHKSSLLRNSNSQLSIAGATVRQSGFLLLDQGTYFLITSVFFENRACKAERRHSWAFFFRFSASSAARGLTLPAPQRQGSFFSSLRYAIARCEGVHLVPIGMVRSPSFMGSFYNGMSPCADASGSWQCKRLSMPRAFKSSCTGLKGLP